MINTAAGMESSVVKALSKIRGVKNAHVVTGLHDAICYVQGKDLPGSENARNNYVSNYFK